MASLPAWYKAFADKTGLALLPCCRLWRLCVWPALATGELTFAEGMRIAFIWQAGPRQDGAEQGMPVIGQYSHFACR